MQIQTNYSRTGVGDEVKSATTDGDHEQFKAVTSEFESLIVKSQKTGDNPMKDSKIQKLIDNIDQLKEHLDQQLTMDGLRDYKEAVRSFLQHYTQNELKMDQQMLKDRRGYSQKVSIIKSIDGKIGSLTENMLETNQGHLETLRRIGEINGLILNLYV